jgi:hypothetical protein
MAGLPLRWAALRTGAAGQLTLMQPSLNEGFQLTFDPGGPPRAIPLHEN